VNRCATQKQDFSLESDGVVKDRFALEQRQNLKLSADAESHPTVTKGATVRWSTQL